MSRTRSGEYRRRVARALVWAGLGVCLGAIPSTVAAQEALVIPSEREPAEHVTGLWWGFYTKYQLTDRLFYYGEYHLRTRETFTKEMAQIYLRFGMTYRLDKQLELTGGVVTPFYWAPGEQRGEGVDTVVPQFRFWEQALFSQKVGKVRVYHQLRTEQRWARKYAEGSPFKLTWRFRYKLATYIPLSKRAFEPNTLFLSSYAEIFMQTGSSIVYNHFEDFRLFGGLGYVLSKTLQLQLGYMWTYRHAGSPFRYEHRHIPRISLSHNTDFGALLDLFR